LASRSELALGRFEERWLLGSTRHDDLYDSFVRARARTDRKGDFAVALLTK
jgi:hypothetical protein